MCTLNNQYHLLILTLMLISIPIITLRATHILNNIKGINHHKATTYLNIRLPLNKVILLSQIYPTNNNSACLTFKIQ